MKKLFCAILILISVSQITAQIPAAGYVFEDVNENNVREPGEKGISQVAVSNGRQVVLTDETGKYSLEVDNDDIIFVIKPSGYAVSKDKNNLPQFFYIHKPDGSPQLEYPGVKPTGSLPESIDFGLLPAKEDNDFTTLVFGDPQPYNLQQVDHFGKGIISELEGVEDVSFGLSLGDLVGNDLDLFDPYIKQVKRIGIPWYNVLGNHDLNFDVETDKMSDETFEASFGPANYSFNYGQVHFIILDDILYPDPRDGKGYLGGLREDQLEFVKNDLKYVPKDYLIVLAFHIPVSGGFREEDRKILFDLLKDYPNTLSLSAHTHLQGQYFLGKEYDWPQEKPHHHYNVGTTSGDWYSGKLDDNGVPFSTMADGTPKGYALLKFEGNKYVIDYKVAGKPEDYKMEIFAPKVVAQGRNTKSGIYVNFFTGSQNDEVYYRVDEGEWKAMTYTEDYDPSYIAYVYEWELSEELLQGRRSTNPKKSTHLWRGAIPTKLDEGIHTIEVKVTDMFDRTFFGTSTYRIENPN